MTRVDVQAPLSFLRAGYQPDDWLAVLLKSYETGQVVQRVGPVATIRGARFQAWLRARNSARWNVYVSVNAVRPHGRSRARDAIHVVRHLFLDADRDGWGVVGAIAKRGDIPPPSYLLHSSPNRLHILWRVRGLDREHAEGVQKDLARQLGTDPAATSCAQTTRLPGFFNHKYRPAPLVTIAYKRVAHVYSRTDFPDPPPRVPVSVCAAPPPCAFPHELVERARRYVAALPPAVAGEYGDLHTFRVCCRVVRGFALDDGDALVALREWNARCRPPWTERELMAKCRRARQYGREPIGGLVRGRQTQEP